MNISQFSLEGKVALVTGGSRGIGRATAIGFAKAGADVAVTARDTEGRGLPSLKEVTDEIKGLGRKALAVAAHIGRMDQLQGLVDRVVAEFGRIDILVNNAGTSGYTPVLEVAEKHWDAIINVNLKGLFFLSQAAARVMKEQGGGKIINVSSLSGFKPEFEVCVYSISKAGVLMATKSLAQELAKYNIRVNAIAPGGIQTRLLEASPLIGDLPKQVPLARIGEPREIADAMIYLASDASSYVTGQTVIVDGGLMLKH